MNILFFYDIDAQIISWRGATVNTEQGSTTFVAAYKPMFFTRSVSTSLCTLYDSWNNTPWYKDSYGKGRCEALMTSYYAHHSQFSTMITMD